MGGFLERFPTISVCNQVTKVKIAKSDWEDLRIRELAYTWTRQIRLFMTTRVLTYGLGSFLRNRDERNVLAILSFSIDLYMSWVIYTLYWMKPEKVSKTVHVHGSAIIPTFIQSLHIVGFLLACYFEFNDPTPRQDK